MRLLTIDRGTETCAGVVVGDAVLDLCAALPDWRPASAWAVLNGGEAAVNAVRALVESHRFDGAMVSALADVRCAAPLPQPGLIMATGYQTSNFRAAYKDGAQTPQEPSGMPKPAGCVIGPDAPIVLPAWMPDKVDFEGELAAVIGRPCNNVSVAEAMKYVAGYTIVNDVSARDNYPVEEANPRGDAAERVARLGKSLPSFCPLGPMIVTADEIVDPTDLTLTTTVNGETMQEARMDGLIHTIAELVAYFARWFPFRPGDVITTGSPPGCGIERKPQVFLKDGDVVSVTVDKIGTLTNPVVAS